uniref:Reverse transcriptase domain-containing protein n=1 Tax=Nothobranchius furzeri TaxID=105023 RepID=A0A8C6NV21_NOTFU
MPTLPSLFAIFIEPLAAAIRQETNIKGIECKKIEHKIILYADDVLLFLQNSQSSLSHAIELINSFSRVSDYSINWLKSTVLPTNFSFVNLLNTQLKSGNITYLGINVSPKLADLTKLNYIPLLKKVEDDLERWKSLPISLMGRVATIKMMVLPRINYLFSMIPNKPPADWFKSLDSSITKFLWQDKPPRISLKTLQKTKDRGGLDLPNFYYTNNIPDNYIHALWSCPPVQEFWGRVCEDLSKCLKCHIPTSPSLCLLGNLDDVPIETSLVHVVLTAICIAKKTILLNWKNRETLCINQHSKSEIVNSGSAFAVSSARPGGTGPGSAEPGVVTPAQPSGTEPDVVLPARPSGTGPSVVPSAWQGSATPGAGPAERHRA